MAQHFLLSPAAKTLSLIKVMRMTDQEAREVFRAMRWQSTDGEPVCPECGCLEHYDLKSRPVWKCKGCSKQFSETSGTIFHSRKLAIRDKGAIEKHSDGRYSVPTSSGAAVPEKAKVRFAGGEPDLLNPNHVPPGTQD